MLWGMKPNTLVNAGSLLVDHSPVPPDQVVGGRPRTGVAPFGSFGGLEVGVWEMTPGTMCDVEAEEIFVVLSGSAVVEFGDGTPALTLAVGDVVRLAAGARTVWTVTETLRKVYLS